MNSLSLALDASVALTRTISGIFARLMGWLLLAIVMFIGAEIIMRKVFNHSLPGVHEYAGYLLAMLSAWGLSHTLLERAHIRIDVVHGRLPVWSRHTLDVLAMAALNLVAWTIAIHAWPVLAKSLSNGSTANTPLATPLWIPQLVWLSGYIWFAITTSVLGLRVIAAIFARDGAALNAVAGVDHGSDQETAQSGESA
ncbi:TRAP transporter small permease subunit [Halomonas binhaiensis]|uniref:TRAP transporter small permease protein n=1 Tax=Halomonas binhaiensis TaxID=2562282 RepID=A0A5C1NF95_9GAMM|nr:TRAP transporter small permease [Halomonas binhaiensis]QEM80339.1 TRAP transporter small permease [Halomonas binhaiensis]